MEINRPPNLKNPLPVSPGEIDTLKLKLNQQLEVKVISSRTETLTLALQTSLTEKPIEVQSNLQIKTKPGQLLQLLVTKTAPQAEFSVLSSKPELQLTESIKPDNKDQPSQLKQILLKQVLPTVKNNITTGDISAANAKNSVTANDTAPADVKTTLSERAGLLANKAPAIPVKPDNPATPNTAKTVHAGSLTDSISPIKPNLDSSANLSQNVITAKILSVTDEKIQLKLYTHPAKETDTYNKNPRPNILQRHNPVITLDKASLLPAEMPPSQTSSKQQPVELIQSIPNQAKDSPQTGSKQQSVEPISLKPGQNIQLEVSKGGLNPDFKIVISKPNLITGQTLTAKVIDINNDKIQLAIYKENLPNTNKNTAISNPQTETRPSQIISVSPRQLTPAVEKESSSVGSQSAIENTAKPLKPGQTLILEVKITGSHPEFKIIESSSAKLNVGQIITANVMNVKNNTVQLQLQPVTNPAGPIPFKTDQPGKNPGLIETKTTTQPAIVTLNKNQFTVTPTDNQTAVKTKTPAVDINALKPGQNIKLEVIKTGTQPEFQLIQATNNPEQKILETLQQVIPIQAQPSELINLIKANLATINKNEKIPDALKRIAREILDSLPQVKNLQNPGELKRTISQSGLFLEANLAGYTEENAAEFDHDLKNQLLKLRHIIQQELETGKEQKTQSNELNLMKEMQQKTENSLAKIIMNQLTSLPKEDAPRQEWIVDLPFFNEETAATIKIEIDHEQQTENNDNPLNWTVTVTVTPPELGTIHCKIACIDKTVNTRFWSDHQKTVTKINEHLDYLKSQFEKAGITPGQFTAHRGLPSTEISQKIIDRNLFDQEV